MERCPARQSVCEPECYARISMEHNLLMSRPAHTGPLLPMERAARPPGWKACKGSGVRTPLVQLCATCGPSCLEIRRSAYGLKPDIGRRVSILTARRPRYARQQTQLRLASARWPVAPGPSSRRGVLPCSKRPRVSTPEHRTGAMGLVPCCPSGSHIREPGTRGDTPARRRSGMARRGVRGPGSVPWSENEHAPA